MVEKFLFNGREWQKEWLFHVAQDCQVAIFLNRMPQRREVEHIIRILQLSLDQGIYDNEPKRTQTESI